MHHNFIIHPAFYLLDKFSFSIRNHTNLKRLWPPWVHSVIRLGFAPYIPPGPLKAPNILKVLFCLHGWICKDGLSTIHWLFLRLVYLAFQFRDYIRSTPNDIACYCATSISFMVLFLFPLQWSSILRTCYPLLAYTWQEQGTGSMFVLPIAIPWALFIVQLPQYDATNSIATFYAGHITHVLLTQ